MNLLHVEFYIYVIILYNCKNHHIFLLNSCQLITYQVFFCQFLVFHIDLYVSTVFEVSRSWVLLFTRCLLLIHWFQKQQISVSYIHMWRLLQVCTLLYTYNSCYYNLKLRTNAFFNTIASWSFRLYRWKIGMAANLLKQENCVREEMVVLVA